MVRNTLGTMTVRIAAESKDWFRESFEASGANSQGEFITQLLEKWNAAEPPSNPEIKTVTVEKELQPNEIIVSLTPAQMFALRGTVLTFPDFAERQNEIIDSLNGSKPFLYFGNLYDPEFKKLWIRNIVITKTMSEPEKENVIKYNMGAFLINMFLMHIIEGNISETNINASNLKAFIRKIAQPKEVISQLKEPQNE